jgi:hypothetical protein
VNAMSTWRPRHVVGSRSCCNNKIGLNAWPFVHLQAIADADLTKKCTACAIIEVRWRFCQCVHDLRDPLLWVVIAACPQTHLASTSVEPATRQEVVVGRNQRPPDGGCGGADGTP